MTGMYSLMAAIREMETKAGDLYLEKIIRGFLHRCNGQVCFTRGKRSPIKVSIMLHVYPCAASKHSFIMSIIVPPSYLCCPDVLYS